jgi:hypothetical protein
MAQAQPITWDTLHHDVLQTLDAMIKCATYQSWQSKSTTAFYYNTPRDENGGYLYPPFLDVVTGDFCAFLGRVLSALSWLSLGEAPAPFFANISRDRFGAQPSRRLLKGFGGQGICFSVCITNPSTVFGEHCAFTIRLTRSDENSRLGDPWQFAVVLRYPDYHLLGNHVELRLSDSIYTPGAECSARASSARVLTPQLSDYARPLTVAEVRGFYLRQWGDDWVAHWLRRVPVGRPWAWISAHAGRPGPDANEARRQLLDHVADQTGHETTWLAAEAETHPAVRATWRGYVSSAMMISLRVAHSGGMGCFVATYYALAWLRPGLVHVDIMNELGHSHALDHRRPGVMCELYTVLRRANAQFERLLDHAKFARLGVTFDVTYPCRTPIHVSRWGTPLSSPISMPPPLDDDIECYMRDVPGEGRVFDERLFIREQGTSHVSALHVLYTLSVSRGLDLCGFSRDPIIIEAEMPSVQVPVMLWYVNDVAISVYHPEWLAVLKHFEVQFERGRLRYCWATQDVMWTGTGQSVRDLTANLAMVGRRLIFWLAMDTGPPGPFGQRAVALPRLPHVQFGVPDVVEDALQLS